jgi:CheY-like chemotaxis protein
LRNIPIVIVTGSTENLDRLNVDRVLRKPASPDELVEAVRKCLGSGRALKPSDQPT